MMTSMTNAIENGEETPIIPINVPSYVLDEGLSSRTLWEHTAGKRPPQPVEERAYYEQIWATNYANSNVKYNMPMEVLLSSSPVFISLYDNCTNEKDKNDPTFNIAALFTKNASNKTGSIRSNKDYENIMNTAAVDEAKEATLVHGVIRSAGLGRTNYQADMGPHDCNHTVVNKKISNDDVTVLFKGDNVFGSTVSKRFTEWETYPGWTTPESFSVSISLGCYRVVESKNHGKYAQFLVIYCEGNFRETVGVWRRHSDFERLSEKVFAGQDECASFHPLSITQEQEDDVLPNAMTSWKLLKKRKRWFRCLDAGYLSLKVFLLERFLHDILFESTSPKILRDFVGIEVA